MNKQQMRNLILSAGILLALFSTSVQAQDWTDGSFTLWNSFGSAGTGDGQFQQADGIAVDENGLIYVSDYQLHRIQVFKADGSFVRKWGTQGSGVNQFENPRGLDIGPDGNLYVCDWGNHRICVYQPDGTFVRSWGSLGTGDGQFNNPIRISIDGGGSVFVSDYENNRVQVFNPEGTFIKKISLSNHPVMGIAAIDDGGFYVGAGSTESDSARSIQQYDADGQFVRTVDYVQYGDGKNGIAINDQGILIDGRGSWVSLSSPPRYNGRIAFVNNSGEVLSAVSGSDYNVYNVSCMPNGGLAYIANLYPLACSEIRIGQWVNRVVPVATNVGVWANIEQVTQRAGYPYLDIDFRANSDNGATNAQVAMCAFLGGNIAFTNLIPMRTFIDNTGTNLGSSVKLSSGLKRVTWNMAADWSANTGNLQVQAFAQKGPYYLSFNWLTIPAGGGVSNSFQICSTPVSNDDLKQVWMFLVASGDPGVALSNGAVCGVSGVYAGQILAEYREVTYVPGFPIIGSKRTQTTDVGRDFLWERMNLREPTVEELAWAKEATAPGIQQWTPRYQVGGRPSKVNEFGLDTGASTIQSAEGLFSYTSSFWAVKK